MSDTNNRAQPLGRRVLCIDDNCDVLQLEKSILEKAGFEVILSNDGAAGLNLARDGNVDLVVLDHEMPQITGAEIARRIRTMQLTIPIIMVSGSLLPEDAAGIVDSFIPKSEVITLVREVNRLLGYTKAASE
jgi:CheY-like chemotaxis protein